MALAARLRLALTDASFSAFSRMWLKMPSRRPSMASASSSWLNSMQNFDENSRPRMKAWLVGLGSGNGLGARPGGVFFDMVWGFVGFLGGRMVRVPFTFWVRVGLL